MTAALTMIDSTGPDGNLQGLVDGLNGPPGSAGAGRSPLADLCVRRGAALLVAGVAAYSSYQHQRLFAAAGGTDPTGARLWPLSVDGLVLLASLGLLRTGPHTRRRDRNTLWAAFGLGIAVSLAANIAAAPALGWQPVLVAGWPPIALLLAVDLLAHRPPPAPSQPTPTPAHPPATTGVSPTRAPRVAPTGQQWLPLSSACGATTSANAQPGGRRPAPSWTGSPAPTTTAGPSSPALRVSATPACWPTLNANVAGCSSS